MNNKHRVYTLWLVDFLVQIFFPLFFTVCSTTLATYSSIFTKKKNINIFEFVQKQKSLINHNPKKNQAGYTNRILQSSLNMM